jgi:hypothetical protein
MLGLPNWLGWMSERAEIVRSRTARGAVLGAVLRAGLPRLTALIGAVLVGATLVGSPAHAKRVAFVVGINNYENLGPNQQLSKAVADARATADAFKALGFEVIKAENSKRNAFFQSWQRFLNLVQPGDVTAVYFAGHGVELQNVNYLLASDIPNATDGADVLKSSAIDIPALIERLKEQQPQVSLIIIDACRDNPYPKKGTRSVGASRGLGGSDPPKGTFLMMSAGKGEAALDALSGSDSNPNSVYTRKLIPLLREPGLEITDIALRVRSEVTDLAKTVGHEQSPAFYHQLTGKFFLNEPRAAPVAVNTPRVPNGTAEAAEAWAAVEQTRSVAVLQSFMRRYGDTFFGDLAKQRIDEINRGSAAAPPPSAALGRPAPEPQRPVPNLAEAAARGWDSVGRSSDIAELEEFARRFERTIYGDLARARITELRKVAVVTPAAPTTPVRQPPPTAAPAPPEPVTAPAVRLPSPVFQAAQAWAAVKDSSDLTALESFAKQHGETIYGPLANSRIEQLKRITVAAAPPEPVRSAVPTAAPAAPVGPPPAPVSITPPAAAAKPTSTLEAGRAWNNTKNSDNPAVIERFIAQHGDSIYGAPARERLTELTGKPAPVPPPAPAVVASATPAAQASVSAFEAAQAWNNTKNSENPAVLERFIKQYGETIYGPPAKARLAELLRQPNTAAAPLPAPAAVVVPPSAQPAATAQEAAQAWNNTQRSESPAVLEHFIKQYGDSIHGPAARARLEELRRKPGARTATADADPAVAAPPSNAEAAQAWNNTKDTTSRVVVERFLKQYGDSIYGEQARAKLKQLN